MRSVYGRTLLFTGFLGLLVAGVTGCTTYHRDAGSDYLTRPADATRVPYRAEFEIGQKRISAHGDAAVVLWFFQISDGKYCQMDRNPHLSLFTQIAEFFSPTQKAVMNAKNAALYNACQINRADQLLASTFDYKITDYLVYSRVECSVKGYPATVKGVKEIDRVPVILNQWQKVEYLTPYDRAQNFSASPKPEANLLLNNFVSPGK